MFKQLSRLILPIVAAISAAGCSNTPTATKADIPLVHSSLAYSLAPDKELAINIPKANVYHDTQESFLIRFNGHQYEASKHYISATGNKCIRFSLQDGEAASSRYTAQDDNLSTKRSMASYRATSGFCNSAR